MVSEIGITVYGTPAPQGSKKGFYNAKLKRVLMVESSDKVKPWRESVKLAALDANGNGRDKIHGAVAVGITFTIAKPKSAPKRTVTWPDRKPDLDKLCRATLDALSEAGVFEDDARVVRLTASKVFPMEGLASLKVPGAMIYVTKVG